MSIKRRKDRLAGMGTSSGWSLPEQSMNTAQKRVLTLLVCIILGLCIGVGLHHFASNIKQLFYIKTNVFQPNETVLIIKDEPLHRLQWSDLIPENEKTTLQKYQRPSPQTALEFGDQILLSIESSTDLAYQSALQSFNTVTNFDEQYVSISGFVVPLDFTKDKTPSNIFIVPYFGACTHFPAPPPNQMIFAPLNGSFNDFDITQAYTVKGILRQEIFEDQLGSSAYTLAVTSIEPYYGEPDDFRQH